MVVVPNPWVSMVNDAVHVPLLLTEIFSTLLTVIPKLI